MKKNLKELSGEFEDLSWKIMKYLLDGYQVEIEKTKASKDGGYDILVSKSNNNKQDKIYCESKLRSSNLNLRDIAANLIIAFNEHAKGLVIITNYNYTEQASKNIKEFYDNSVLNIKIIVGEDINKIIDDANLTINQELADNIKYKEAKRKTNSECLRLNFEKKNYYEQLFSKTNSKKIIEKPFVIEVFNNQYEKLKRLVNNDEVILIKGFLGVGKSTFIKYALSNVDKKIINLSLSNFTTKNYLLLDIILKISGINTHKIIEEFSNDIIKNITDTIEEKFNAKVGKIVKYLFTNENEQNISDENFNLLISKYIVKLLSEYKNIYKYVFVFDSINGATEEIKNLFLYFIKLLKKEKIACIIEIDEEEYVTKKVELENNKSFFQKLNDDFFYSIEIRYLNKVEAEEFLLPSIEALPEHLKPKILNKGGQRFLTLKIIADYITEKFKNQLIDSNITKKIDMFSANDIPVFFDKLITIYYEECDLLFHYLYLFDGEVAIDIIDENFNSNEIIIDKLISLNILNLDSNSLTISNELYLDIITKHILKHKLILRQVSKALLKIIEDSNNNSYIKAKINIYFALGKFSEAYKTTLAYMQELKSAREYTLFLKYSNKILQKNKSDYNITDENYILFLFEVLEVWNIKKEIHLDSAIIVFEKLDNEIAKLTSDKLENYTNILNYYKSKKFFKECDFEKSKAISSPYFLKLKSLKEVSKNDEVIVNLSVVYALSVKELRGNNDAKKIFDIIIKCAPNFFQAQVEYWSHEACLNFYNNPKYSLKNINNILNYYESHSSSNYDLPFHEYVDKAMCALCAKDYQNGLEYSNEAIEILSSNGIFPTLGRAYNIKACILLALGEKEQAEKYFRDACYTMVENNYSLFSWRSNLNLVYLKILNNEYDNEIITLLNETYQYFIKKYQNKVKAIERDENFIVSREYLALLMFAQLYRFIDDDKVDSISNTFLLNEEERNDFKNHVNQLCDPNIDDIYFKDSAYSLGKYLFVVG